MEGRQVWIQPVQTRPMGLQMNEAETTAVQGCSGRVLVKDGHVREYLGAIGSDQE